MGSASSTAIKIQIAISVKERTAVSEVASDVPVLMHLTTTMNAIITMLKISRGKNTILLFKPSSHS